jgi:hypothetical protein
VHASASPFEGLAERTNWLGVAIADDPFGKVLLAAGIPEATIKKWSSDPQVTYDAETAKSTGKTTRSKVPPLGSARSRLLRLLRARLVALGSGTPRKRPAHWAPSRGLGGCSS